MRYMLLLTDLCLDNSTNSILGLNENPELEESMLSCFNLSAYLAPISASVKLNQKQEADGKKGETVLGWIIETTLN
jgi:hypothetical protein